MIRDSWISEPMYCSLQGTAGACWKANVRSIRLQNDPMKPCPNYQIRKGFQSMSPNSYYLGRNPAFWSNDVVDAVLAFAVAVVFAAVAVVVADIVSLDLAHVIALAHAVVYFYCPCYCFVVVVVVVVVVVQELLERNAQIDLPDLGITIIGWVWHRGSSQHMVV